MSITKLLKEEAMHTQVTITTTFHWNRLICLESQHDPHAALPLYKSMRARSVPPNNHTFPSILKACAALRDPLHTRQLHAQLTRLGLLHSHLRASASLIDAYGKCRRPESAIQVFEEIPQRDLDPVIWTSLITSLSINGLTKMAFETFACMRRSDDAENGRGDAVTLAALVSSSETLFCGRMLHTLAVKNGFDSDTRLANTIVHMYAILEAVEDVLKGFGCIPVGRRDIVSWNTVIAGLTMNGKNEDALSVFDEMVAAGATPSCVTLVSVLKCCAQLGCSETSQRIHDYIATYHSPLPDNVVFMTALVDMHARCGDLEQARQIFNRIKGKNTVCWSAMIAGYEQASRPEEAMHLFKRMLLEVNVKPNAITMLSVAAACSTLGASRPGRIIHKYVITSGLDTDCRVLSALIDMYAKCGDINLARRVFAETGHVEKSVVLWTAMIGAEGMHGGGHTALLLFSEMQDHGLQPNEVTLISVLSACSHAGLVEEGMSCFRNMEENYGFTPNQKHYACVVDLLGRAGKLDEAHGIICEMPIKPDLAVWGSLLGACHIYGNFKLGKAVEEKILDLDPSSLGHRVLLANMYSSTGRWDDVIRMRVDLKKNRVRKEPGCSFIEVGSKVYGFIAEDRSHPDTELIYGELQALDLLIKEAGYTKAVPSYTDVDHLEVGILAPKDGLIRSEYHSERLAIAFAIVMSKRSGIAETKSIRITKNLRVCRDCHNYTKFVSEVIQRELIVRDAHRFHHFKDGLCSCKDYW